jgi:hypothetical protein
VEPHIYQKAQIQNEESQGFTGRNVQKDVAAYKLLVGNDVRKDVGIRGVRGEDVAGSQAIFLGEAELSLSRAGV